MEPTEYTDLVLEVAADMRAYNEQAAICVWDHKNLVKRDSMFMTSHMSVYTCLLCMLWSFVIYLPPPALTCTSLLQQLQIQQERIVAQPLHAHCIPFHREYLNTQYVSCYSESAGMPENIVAVRLVAAKRKSYLA